MRKFYQRFLAVRDIPVPVVAAINGPAIGAGAAVVRSFTAASHPYPHRLRFAFVRVHSFIHSCVRDDAYTTVRTTAKSYIRCSATHPTMD